MNTPSATSPARVTAPMPDCWRTIGVSGDRSCPELAQFIHCRNCPVLAEAARAFFDRPAPEGYLESWRDVLEQPETEGDSQATSVLVFRVGPEWLALPAAALVEITPPRRLHRLPHLRGKILSGLVNIRGQLQLCVSLGGLLGLDHGADTGGPAHAPRLLVVERGGDRWVFAVDEVAGVHRVPSAELRAVPSTVSAGAMPMTAALFSFHDRTVGLLDDTRLLDGLRGRILE